jgi:hypothetical protein
MHSNQIIIQRNVPANNLHQVIQSEVKREQAQSRELSITDVALSLSPLGFLFGWVAFFIIMRKIRTYLDNKMVFSINGLNKLPCRNCQFYSNNHYLKCAVNPSLVLTEEAKDCSEYISNKRKFTPPNLFKKGN